MVCILNDPCENGGTCSEVDGFNASCACADGYTGSLCETRKKLTPFLFTFLKSCGSAQIVFCENVFVKDVFWCSALVCTLNDPCQNNATCIEIGDGVNVNCSCLDGYTDPLCQTGAFDPTQRDPLNPTAICVFHLWPISCFILRLDHLACFGFRFGVCSGQPVSKWRHMC